MVSAIDALIQASSHHPSGLGVLNITNTQTKAKARVFFRDSGVYAAEREGFHPPLAERLKWSFNGGIDMDDVFELQRRVSPEYLRYELQRNQIIGTDTARTVSRDFFINAMDEILTWKDVKTLWKQGEMLPQKTGYSIKPIEVEKLRSVLADYEGRLLNFCQNLNIEPADLRGVAIHPENLDVGIDKDTEYFIIETLKQRNERILFNEVIDKSEVFGLINVISATRMLWLKGAISFNIKGIQVKNDPEGQLKKTPHNNPQTLTPQPTNTPKVDEPIKINNSTQNTVPVSPPSLPPIPPHTQTIAAKAPGLMYPFAEELFDANNSKELKVELHEHQNSLNLEPDFKEPEISNPTTQFEEENIDKNQDTTPDLTTPETEPGLNTTYENNREHTYGLTPHDETIHEDFDGNLIDLNDEIDLESSPQSETLTENTELLLDTTDNQLDDLIQNIQKVTIELQKQIHSSENREKELEKEENKLIEQISQLELTRERVAKELETTKSNTRKLEIKLSRLRTPLT